MNNSSLKIKQAIDLLKLLQSIDDEEIKTSTIEAVIEILEEIEIS